MLKRGSSRLKSLLYNTIAILLLIMLTIISNFVVATNARESNNLTAQGFGIYNSKASANSGEIVTRGDINIYFYRLGAKNADGSFRNANAEGDSFIIVVGDVEILVDAGADVGSAEAIRAQMRKHVSSDKVWDYIIVTHADKDHIAALGAPTLDQSVFNLFMGGIGAPEMKLGHLIDFDITQDATNTFAKKDELFLTKNYQQYSVYRERLVREKGVKYYTASQCLWRQRGLKKAPIKGLTNVFALDDKGTTLNILDNYYCYNKYNPDIQVAASDRNNLCVCFTIDAHNEDGKVDRFLFTGDLEEYDSSTKDYSPIYGETKLVEHNPQLKEGVVFYKAGHHGSRTSSSQTFIDNIRPQHVVFTGIAGNNSNNHEPNSEHSYPALEVVNNVFKYTDKIYIPARAEYDNEGNKTVVDYYGEIAVNYNYGQGLTVECSNNMDEKTNKPLLIQNTEWFKKYRQSQINVFALSSYVNDKVCSFGNCTLIKYGHYDILIDCGIYTLGNVTQINSTVYLDKLKTLCVDRTIEYLIVTSPNTYSLQQLTTKNVNTKKEQKGVLKEFEIENIIDFGNIPDPSRGFDRSLYSCYQKEKRELIDNGTKYYPVNALVNKDLAVTEDLFIDVLHNEHYGTRANSDVSVTIDFRGKKFLFLGNNRKEGLDSINTYAKKGINNLDNIVMMQIPTNGEIEAYSSELYMTVFNNAKDITLISNSILNENFFDRDRFTKEFCNHLIYDNNQQHNIYVSSESNEKLGNKQYREICGDIQYSIFYQMKGKGNDPLNFECNVSCSTNNLVSIEQTEYYQLL